MTCASAIAQTTPVAPTDDKVVLLENPTDGVFIVGELLDVNDANYRVRTAVGDLLVPVAQVIRTGAPGRHPCGNGGRVRRGFHHRRVGHDRGRADAAPAEGMCLLDGGRVDG